MKLILMNLALLIGFGGVSLGCSGTKQIARIGNKILAEVSHGREALEKAATDYRENISPLPAIETADEDFRDIGSLASEVHLAVTRVHDTTPWWVTPLVTVLVSVGVLVFLVYFGEPLKRLFLLLLPVPSHKRSVAKLLNEGQVEQAVAILREGDPHMNRAYQNVNAAEKLSRKRDQPLADN